MAGKGDDTSVGRTLWRTWGRVCGMLSVERDCAAGASWISLIYVTHLNLHLPWNRLCFPLVLGWVGSWLGPHSSVALLSPSLAKVPSLCHQHLSMPIKYNPLLLCCFFFSLSLFPPSSNQRHIWVHLVFYACETKMFPVIKIQTESIELDNLVEGGSRNEANSAGQHYLHLSTPNSCSARPCVYLCLTSPLSPI